MDPCSTAGCRDDCGFGVCIPVVTCATGMLCPGRSRARVWDTMEFQPFCCACFVLWQTPCRLVLLSPGLQELSVVPGVSCSTKTGRQAQMCWGTPCSQCCCQRAVTPLGLDVKERDRGGARPAALPWGCGPGALRGALS